MTFCLLSAVGIFCYFLTTGFCSRFLPKCSADLFLLALNLFWIYYWFFSIPPILLACFFLFCCVFYYIVTASPWSGGAQLWVSLFCATIFWALAKLSGGIAATHSPQLQQAHQWILPLVGVPYSFCRLVAFSVGVHNKTIQKPQLLPFLCQMFFFPTLLSGPVTRFDNFTAQKHFTLGSVQEYGRQIFIPGASRIVLGIVKKNFMGEILRCLSLPSLNIQQASMAHIALGAYAYYFYLFFDFSGISDMAIGFAKLLKIEVPENFNHPFKARNPQDFWARWHISFCKWLYEFLFAPLYTNLLRLLQGRARILMAGIAIFLTFSFAGVWHGDETKYMREGLCHASALFIFVIFDGTLKQYFPAWRKYMLRSSWVVYCSRVLTFHYVVISFMLFSLDLNSLQFIGKKFLGI